MTSIAYSGMAQCTAQQKVIENFNTIPDPNNNTVMPDCWSLASGGSQIVNNELSLWLTGSASPGILVSPTVQNGEGVVTFKARKTSSYTVYLSVGYYNGSNFIQAVQYTLNGTMQSFTYDFANFNAKTSSETRIAFRITSGPNSGVQRLSLDDIEYKSFLSSPMRHLQ